MSDNDLGEKNASMVLIIINKQIYLCRANRKVSSRVTLTDPIGKRNHDAVALLIAGVEERQRTRNLLVRSDRRR